MTDPNKTAIQLLVDRSGSMQSIRADMQGAINSFVEKQAKEPGEALLWVSDFDDDVVHHVHGADIRKAEGYVLEPRNGTALYDAMGKTIDALGASLSFMPQDSRPGKVIFVIITDGGENASRKFNRQQVMDKVKHQTDTYGWEFVYIGANQDSYAVGAGLGVRASNTMNYGASKLGVATASASMSNYVSNVRAGGSAGFTEEDQEVGEATRTP